MTKHRQTRKRNQKGGAWYNPLTWGQSQDPNVPKKSWGEWFSGASNNAIQGADNAVGSAANFISRGAQNTYSSVFSSNTPPGSPPVTGSPPVSPPVTGPPPATGSPPATGPPPATGSPTVTPPLSTDSQSTASVSSNSSTIGGKRRKRSRRMKGGYKENLAYYAAPVQGLQVAAPTYWVSAKTNPPLSGGSKRRLKKRITRRKTHRHKK
jgi:hypothetical protein